MRLTAALVSLFALGACATASQPQTPPNLTPAPGAAAPVQARLYTACIAGAIAANAFDREQGLIRFHCSGEAARGFYDGLAAWSLAHDSELSDGARTLRFTVKPEEDLYGLDYCWRDAGEVYGCTIALNVGAFLDGE